MVCVMTAGLTLTLSSSEGIGREEKHSAIAIVFGCMERNLGKKDCEGSSRICVLINKSTLLSYILI